ncbi:MAG: hypothetical protein J0I77_13215 [Rudaea sp.]|nr:MULTISPECIES: hypothetical protein [unclassified Rudaea]MBN8886677.1 hypothetical protein [Rudaea sp.]MBR0346717.1 hypothetical protein [Rudaea sp.]
MSNSGIGLSSWFAFVLAAVVPLHSAAAATADYLVVDEDGRKAQWTGDKRSEGVPFPVRKLSLGSACVATAMSIEADGTTANRRVLRMSLGKVSDETREEFKQAALRYFAGAHFTPTEANSARKPVYTYAIFTIERMLSSGPGGASSKRPNDRAAEPCRIPDFVNAVASGKLSSEEN